MKAKRINIKGILSNLFVHVVLGILAIIWVLPIFFTVLTSLRKESGAYKSYIFPKEYTIDNFLNLFDTSGSLNFTRWFGNTFFVAILNCIISVFFVLSVSYVMSRLRFKMRKKLLNIALILGMFPGFMSMIAVYYIIKGMGLLETGQLKLLALVIVYSAGSGLGFYIAKGFFDTISKNIDEAAYIDGASKWDVFTKITIPLSKPIIVYTVLSSFMGPWVDFIFARVILGQDKTYYTIAVGLWTMLEAEFIEYYYTRFFAGCVLISIPIAILFLIVQRYYVESVGGAVKG